ncbi:DNA starvation/stationary phase protection protein Dps [Leptolyngbya sp. FACHB-261]|uniref:DNA starvation/stationary phase protection protein Dps n=1 Tax=Leptolyngbya sp. FACHB-261 TaxID=2692806 RepID=UPI001684B6BE|nr:DNA starvation/stationary phase protection protein Dps [Leptolyngbya sp. FACHB-261]MBD2099681.1 DNA starvation/stationary phase protection protein Dps [Leptolyngbya sp. FACHB-261]
MAVSQTKTAKTAQYQSRINIPAEKRTQLIGMLNQHLADTLDLYTQVKQAHWNVKGMNFYQLHLLFDELATEVLGFVDLLAERATTLGGIAQGTARMAAEASALPEYPLGAVEGREHVEALVERYGQYSSRIRTAIDDSDSLGDKDTADLYTEISRAVDMRLWFLEAHLQSSATLD